MSTSGSQIRKKDDCDDKTLCKFVTKLGSTSTAGGNVSFTCNFC